MLSANLLSLKTSPLTNLYDFWYAPFQKGALATKKTRFKQNNISILNGPRTKRYPLIALTTQRSMGPSRHILSQRVVAGTMVVSPPYQPSQTTQNKT